MNILKSIWGWAWGKILTVMFIFAIVIKGLDMWWSRWGKPRVGPSEKENKLREETVKVEIEAEKAKTEASVEARLETEKLTDAGSEPDGSKRRQDLADLLNH